ncbi:MAG: OmpH family outer membrane protein [Gemmatimonadaceae bacterium]|nr:OmpH family outer membrane protein [Gemmatimonadaceae bacterium]
MTRALAAMILGAGATHVVAAQQAAPAAPAAAAPAGPLKLGYVNSRQLLEGAPGRTEAEAQFEKEMTGFRSSIQRMSDSLQALIGNYEKAAQSLTPTQRQTRENAIRQVQGEFQQRTQQMEQQAQQRQQELMQPIMDQINKVIQDMRAEQGYSLILDAGAQVPLIVSADKALDLTEAVMARLKTLGPPKLPPVQAQTQPAPGSVVPTPSRTGPASAPTGATRPGGRP